DQLLFQEKSSIDSARQKNAVTLANYKIQPQDLLQVRNLQNIGYITGDGGSGSSSSSGGGTQGASGGQTYQVEEDGTVALPVIGHVQVVGLTRMEATKVIEDLYRKTLLKDPIIELKIVNLKVTLLGEVKEQGNFPLVKDRTTLVEMLGQAGGLTDKANERNVQIIRGDQNNPQVTVVNLRDINSINDPSTILRNGDIVYVAQNKRAIRGDKLSNFSTIVQPVLIILNTALVIYTLARH
ncbi:MAG: polysaccharide biosynthesis/export family protein, partial [Mucilaginibacter sp.]